MKTLLNGVNEVLKKAKLIQGDSGLLTSLTDSARQLWIDNAIQAWNETIEELYSVASEPMPKELAENTITLATNDRDYALQSDLVILHWPFLDETTGQKIYEWKGDYLSLTNSQTIPANYTGLPRYGVIRPTDGELYLDYIPTSQENGLIYKYRYDKDISVSVAADAFPFEDIVFRALVPAVTEIFNLYFRREMSESLYNQSMGRAARNLTKSSPRQSYLPARIRGTPGIAFPFDG